ASSGVAGTTSVNVAGVFRDSFSSAANKSAERAVLLATTRTFLVQVMGSPRLSHWNSSLLIVSRYRCPISAAYLANAGVSVPERALSTGGVARASSSATRFAGSGAPVTAGGSAALHDIVQRYGS